jgi:hypothetical protein
MIQQTHCSYLALDIHSNFFKASSEERKDDWV